MSRTASLLTLGLFFVSIVSGLIIVFAYHPSIAFGSVQKMNFLIPYGLFFRKLHYFSSEAFTIFLLFHILLELIKNKIRISSSSWNYSILGFIAVIILMFSGFVLKADLDASGAAQVAFSLIKDTPVLKYLLPLFKDNSVFYYKFFIWHIVYLPLILTFAIYKHIDTLKVKSTILSIAFGITVLSMIVFKMPLDIIPGEKVKTLSSPWFFIGAEHLLQQAWTPLSINLFLSIPFFLLIVYFYTKYKYTTKSLLSLWILYYSYVSIFLP